MKINRNNYEAWFLDYAEGTLSSEQVAELLLFLENNPDLKEELDSFELISLAEETPVFESKNLLKKDTGLSNEDFENKCIAYTEGLLSEKEAEELKAYIAADAEKTRTFRLYQMVKAAHNNERNNERNLLYRNKSLYSTEASDRDLMLVAFYEGWLSKEEKIKVETLAETDASLKKELLLYRNTFLTADPSVVYPDKSELKKGEAKLVYFNWKKAMSYVAAAAVVLLIFTVLNDASEKTETIANSDINKKENKNITPEIQQTETFSSEEKNIADYSAEKKKIEKENSVQKNQKQEKIINETNIAEQNGNAMVNQINPADSSSKNTELPQNNLANSITNQNPNTISADSSSVNEPGKDEYAYAGNPKEREYMSPGEFLRRRANKKVFGKEEVSQDEINESLSRQFTKATGKTVSFVAAQEEEYKEVQFSVGNFSFSRKTKK